MNLLHNHDQRKNARAHQSRAWLTVPTGIHGAVDIEELVRLGLRPECVLDFSANVNPYGPSKSVRDVLARVSIDGYPDRECFALRQALAEAHQFPVDHILPGNGASELIWLAALAFVKPYDRVLVVGPTYCEYARAAELQGARLTICLAEEGTGFVPDLKAINGQLATMRPALVFICNPNNPTGTAIAPPAIASWLKDFPNTLFVVDEAYLAFAADLGSVLEFTQPNLLVLRSMTKDCALAGLRLGYAISQPDLITALRQMQPPWSVNAMAQAAGIAAVRDSAYRQRSIELVTTAKRELVDKLTHMGLSCLPSATHFFLVRAPANNGSSFRHALLLRGVLVRDCTSFGLPAFVRIATRLPEENERLLTAIAEVL